MEGRGGTSVRYHGLRASSEPHHPGGLAVDVPHPSQAPRRITQVPKGRAETQECPGCPTGDSGDIPGVNLHPTARRCPHAVSSWDLSGAEP